MNLSLKNEFPPQKDKKLEEEQNLEIRKSGYEQERAVYYWESCLQNEVRILTPQNPKCEFAIVVPVYNEKPERILRQIETLKNQKNIDFDAFEIIYIVNNDILNESEKFKEIFKANQETIKILKEIHDLNIFVIDKSSIGKEIKNCNVGRARNRAVAEASIRFYENKKDGLLIQTDADTYFEDPNYLSKLKEYTEKNPEVIGIAGGLVWEFNPDTKDTEKITELKSKIESIALMHRWEILVEFIRDPNHKLPTDNEHADFSGANMISRSYETAIIGGINDTDMAEDTQFGLDLNEYAIKKGQKVATMKDELLLVTALRESDRTASSFMRVFNEIDLSKPLMVPDPFIEEMLPEFRKKVIEILNESVTDQTKLRNLLKNNEGVLDVTEGTLEELVSHVKRFGVVEDDPFFRNWIDKNFCEEFNLISHLYDTQYPRIPFTQENYQRLLDKVLGKPNGSKVIEYIENKAKKLRVAA